MPRIISLQHVKAIREPNQLLTMESISEKRISAMSEIVYDPKTFSAWWTNRIATLGDLEDCLRADRSSFVAFDTEYIRNTGGAKVDFEPCTEVGLAFLPTLLEPSASGQSVDVEEPLPRSLQQLVAQYAIKPRCARINGRYKPHVKQDGRPRGKQEPFWLGELDCIEATDLDGYVDAVVGGFKREAGERSLILVGFGLSPDLQRMYSEFPTAGRHFSAWLDIDRLLAGARPERTPGLSQGASLALLGYSHRDSADFYGTPRWVGRHCAGVDAVRSLALLQGLESIDDDLAKGLRLSRSRTKEEGGPRLRIWEGELRQWGYPYSAKVTASGGVGLPAAIDSVLKLSRFVQEAGHAPTLVAGFGDSQDASVRSVGRNTTRCRRTGGWVVFGSEANLIRFVSATHGQIVDGVRLDVVNVFDRPLWDTHQQEAREKRLRRKQKSSGDPSPHDNPGPGEDYMASIFGGLIGTY